jgi:hypothetical protein
MLTLGRKYPFLLIKKCSVWQAAILVAPGRLHSDTLSKVLVICLLVMFVDAVLNKYTFMVILSAKIWWWNLQNGNEIKCVRSTKWWSTKWWTGLYTIQSYFSDSARHFSKGAMPCCHQGHPCALLLPRGCCPASLKKKLEIYDTISISEGAI